MTLRLLTVSTLYPNAMFPAHGIFVETRLRHLLADEGVESVVIAPVPWFPIAHHSFGHAGQIARIARRETRHGIEILHPRYAVIPHVTGRFTPRALFAAFAKGARMLRAEGYVPDAIDAHYLYPDGVAAIRLGRALGLPVVLTARGSDVSEWPDYPGPGRLIRTAIHEADALIAVSEALAEGLRVIGTDPARITTLRNGVDTTLFHPADPVASRSTLGRDRRYLLSVGHLIPRKGHDRAITALAQLDPARYGALDLIIVGAGSERGRLGALAACLGLAERVVFAGVQPQDRLATYYSGAEALILASSREGWANVLLESMACGTPVVASPAWGNPEVVREAVAGLIAETNTPEAIASALGRLLADPPPRAATRAYAERHGWREISAGQRAIFDRVCGRERLVGKIRRKSPSDFSTSH